MRWALTPLSHVTRSPTTRASSIPTGTFTCETRLATHLPATRTSQRGKIVVAKVAQSVERLAYEDSKAFITIDSLALGLWAYLGTVYSLQMGAPPVVAPIMGIITASFGGVLRDVFFARVPQTFMPGQLYATAAAAGAVVYVVLWQLGFGDTIGFLACFALTFLIRMASIRFNILSR